MSHTPQETTAGSSVFSACHASDVDAGAAPGGRIDWPLHRSLRLRGLVWGSVAGIALILVYVLVLGLTNSFQHALDDFARLWPWMTALVAGFALQVGLFAYLRAATRGAGASSGGVVASSGTSALSMVACCAHHLSDVLPLIGLAGAAMFFAQYQNLFLLLGVLSNVVGLVYLLGRMRRHGLFPRESSLLAASVAWPVDRALPYSIVGSVLVLLTTVLVTFA